MNQKYGFRDQRFLIYLCLIWPCISYAQSKEALEKYLAKALSYQHINYEKGGKDCHISIYQVDFKNCTMNYPVFIKNGDKTERYTIRLLLSGTNDIVMGKANNGSYSITFTSGRKSMIKEYPDGTLTHEKKIFIPLKKYDAKALQYIEKLKEICK